MSNGQISQSIDTIQEEYFDPRLLAAKSLLRSEPVKSIPMIYPLMASAGMALASLIFALSVILGPGWDQTAPKGVEAPQMVANGSEHIAGPIAETSSSSSKVQSLARASEFELSSNPEGVTISASEADGLATAKN